MDPMDAGGRRDAWRRDAGDAWSGFRSEAGEALAIVALFVGVGLGGAALAGGAYPARDMGEETKAARDMGEETKEAGPVAAEGGPRLWLVDGFNVLHAVVLKGRDRAEWWRQPARARVLDLASALPDAEAEIWVVFDGEDQGEQAELPPRVQQVFAPSADDWMVRRVKDTPPGDAVTVVTADRELAARARHHGAEIVSPRRFAARCRAL